MDADLGRRLDLGAPARPASARPSLPREGVEVRTWARALHQLVEVIRLLRVAPLGSLEVVADVVGAERERAANGEEDMLGLRSKVAPEPEPVLLPRESGDVREPPRPKHAEA